MSDVVEITGQKAASIPVIDIAPLRSKSRDERLAVARQIGEAAQDMGFFYIANHGVSPDLVASAFRLAKEFFSLPLEEKMRLVPPEAHPGRGYGPMHGQALEPGTPPDLKESFIFTLSLPEGDPRVAAGRFGRLPNLWPDSLPEMRVVMERYQAAMVEVRDLLLTGLALSLGLAEDYFAEYSVEGVEMQRLLHYPPQPPDHEPGEKGCGAHTDFGGITILKQDEVGGLQVLDDDTGNWIDAPPIPETFVVNLGDQIQRWTGGRYRSNVHRVISNAGRDRFSIPFFSNGNPDYLIDSLLTGQDGPARAHFEPLTVEQQLIQRITEVRLTNGAPTP